MSVHSLYRQIDWKSSPSILNRHTVIMKAIEEYVFLITEARQDSVFIYFFFFNKKEPVLDLTTRIN